jgi:Ca2+-binding RTX toxin-like protein
MNYGYPQFTIDKENLGLTYVRDAQIKLALYYSNIHLAANYSDLPMNADMPGSTPGYETSWATDCWHLAPSSKEIATQRTANFIALDDGQTHILDNPGPYPIAALADITIYNGPGINVTGTADNEIITGTTGADLIDGGAGNDTIIGAGGGDTLTGGSGSNTFYYMPLELLTVKNGGGTPDIITDFKTGTGGDVIDLSATIYADGYRGTNAVTDGYAIIGQSGADTTISFDPDGKAGPNAAVQIATLLNVQASGFDTSHNLTTTFPIGNTLSINTATPPWAVDDSFTSPLGQALKGNVLADNGHGTDSDPNGLALSTVVANVASLQGGTASVDTAGNFAYTPALGFLGPDSFTYTLKNSAGATDVGTVNVNVTPPPGALVGASGNDSLTGGSRNDIILGLSGNDTLGGGGGNDTIYGGPGSDILNGNAGRDTLYALGGNNVLNGNDDNDTLYAGAGNDTLNGGNGNDTLVASTGNITMSGNSGVDQFILTSLNSSITRVITDFNMANGEKIDISKFLAAYNPQTASISDFVHATLSGSNTILSIDVDGTANGANFVNLVTLNNVTNFDVAGMAATGQLVVVNSASATNHPPVAQPDSFSGYQNQPATGNVLADNGSGKDTDPDGDALSVIAFNGQSANGGTVAMQTNGNFTYNPSSGFSGNDTFGYTLLDGHGGAAQGLVTVSVQGPIVGTNGADTISAGTRNDIINGLDGNDSINGGGGNDTITGGSGNDTMNGNAGNDELHAVSGNDLMHGNDDNDSLYAGAGADSLYGDNGNDTLVAGTGGALMTGGGGADTFRFNGVSGIVDTVTDFHASQADVIDLRSILAGYDPSSMAISDFLHATKQGSDSMLSVDADGTTNGPHFINLALVQGISSFDINGMITSGNLLV